MHQAVKHFIVHFFKSIHLHGIHSPFVYSLQKQCFYETTAPQHVMALKTYRNNITQDTTVLEIEDYGAGSAVFKTNHRAVKDILKVNCTPLKRAELLTRVCSYFNVKNALELGTSLGIGTQALALNGAQVTSVEASTNIYNYAAKQLKAYKNITLVNSTFTAFIDHKTKLKPHATYDLIFIDGHHNGDATIAYFKRLLTLAHNDTVFILDDIYWSATMTKAWKQLQLHERVTASIDTFYWGFLFLRKEQLQQAFNVKL